MISNFFLSVFYWIINNLLENTIGYLPDVSVDSGIGGAFYTAGTYIANLDFVLPVGSFFTVVGMIIAVELILNAYKIAMWTVKLIRGSG